MSLHNLPYARGMIRHADTSYGLPAPITEYTNIEKYRDENALYLHHIASPDLDVGPNPKHKFYSHAMDFHRSDARERTKWRGNLERRRAYDDDHYAVEGSLRFRNAGLRNSVAIGDMASTFSSALDEVQARLLDLRKSIDDINAVQGAQQSCLSCGRGYEDHVLAASSRGEVSDDTVEKNEANADSRADTVAGGGVVAEGGSGVETESGRVRDGQGLRACGW